MRRKSIEFFQMCRIEKSWRTTAVNYRINIQADEKFRTKMCESKKRTRLDEKRTKSKQKRCENNNFSNAVQNGEQLRMPYK